MKRDVKKITEAILAGRNIRKTLSESQEDFQFIADAANKAKNSMSKITVNWEDDDGNEDSITVDPKDATYGIDWYDDGYALGVWLDNWPEKSDKGIELDWGVNVVDDEESDILSQLISALPDSITKNLDLSNAEGSGNRDYWVFIKGSDEDNMDESLEESQNLDPEEKDIARAEKLKGQNSRFALKQACSIQDKAKMIRRMKAVGKICGLDSEQYDAFKYAAKGFLSPDEVAEIEVFVKAA